MTLTINTNISAMIAERNFNNATNLLNKSLERLSTGYTINHAADNAAGYSISDNWVAQLSSYDSAASNASMGADLLNTAEQNYDLLTEHLSRVRDLTVQAANGTYGSISLKAIQAEIRTRFQEISRIASNSEFNGIKLMSYADDVKDTGLNESGINLQVGIFSDDDSVINVGIDLFKNATVSGLFNGKSYKQGTETYNIDTYVTGAANGKVSDFKYNSDAGYEVIAAACSKLKVSSVTDGHYEFEIQYEQDLGPEKMIGFIDKAIDEISNRVTRIGTAQNRIESAISSIEVQQQNLTSSLSTLRDTDVARESSKYIQSQILQQASATLLSAANQTPSIALNLI